MMEITATSEMRMMANTIRYKTQEKYGSRRSKSIAVKNLLTINPDKRSPGTAAIIPALPLNELTFNKQPQQLFPKSIKHHQKYVDDYRQAMSP
jgi:hypothetical protein